MADLVANLDLPVPTISGSVINYFGYISPEEGDTFAAQEIGTDIWTTSTRANRIKAIISSTRTIDTLNFISCKLSDTQPLQFPRHCYEIIPESIKRATFFNAIEILNGRDIEIEIQNLNVLSDKYSQISSTYSTSTPNRVHLVNGILSVKAWTLLLPWLDNPNELNLYKV